MLYYGTYFETAQSYMDTVEIVYAKSNVRESISTSRNIYELYDI